jgi:hypothetical protein
VLNTSCLARYIGRYKPLRGRYILFGLDCRK